MRKSFLALVLAVLFSAVVANAAIQTVPTGLSDGDPYRLVFVTSGVIAGTSSDIAVYNSFVDAAAKSSNSHLKSINTTWTAIASTATIAAIDNTNTQTSITGIPVYLIDGSKVADDYADLWDGLLDAAIQLTELDTQVSASTGGWTGTMINGQNFTDGRELGGDEAVIGSCSSIYNDWISNTTVSTSAMSRPLYAMSDVLYVPEPVTMGLLAIGGLAVLRQRKN